MNIKLGLYIIPILLFFLSNLSIVHDKHWSQVYAENNTRQIIFATSNTDDKFKLDTLILYDIDTSTGRIFYTNPTLIYLDPLAWSPNEQILAVYVQEVDENQAIENKICLLNRDGMLLRCASNPPFFSDEHTFSWSPDSQFIYFLTIDGNQKKLVEIHVSTGLWIRDVFIFSTDEIPLIVTISWSPTLDYIVTNAGLMGELDLPRELINLNEFTAVDLKMLLNPDSVIEYVCPQFSSVNNYFGVLISQNNGLNTHLSIFNNEGTPIHHFDNLFETADSYRFNCPIWLSNDAGFYMVVQNLDNESGYLIKYSINNLSIQHRIALDAMSLSELQVSNDGEMLIGIMNGNELALIEQDAIKTINPSTEILRNPIWMPD